MFKTFVNGLFYKNFDTTFIENIKKEKKKSNEWSFINSQGENLTLNLFHAGFEHVKLLLRATCLRNHPNLSRSVRVEQAHQILT